MHSDSPHPLAVPLAQQPVVRPGVLRFWATLVLAAALAPLALAAWLRPDPRGYGTHRQLGTGPCGMLIVTGYPCPTCGMTTAFAHTVRGQWLRAAWVQPAGFVMALGVAATAVGAGWIVVRGRLPHRWPAWVTPFRLYLALLVLLLGSWGFKIVTGLLDGTLPYGAAPRSPMP